MWTYFLDAVEYTLAIIKVYLIGMLSTHGQICSDVYDSVMIWSQ